MLNTIARSKENGKLQGREGKAGGEGAVLNEAGLREFSHRMMLGQRSIASRRTTQGGVFTRYSGQVSESLICTTFLMLKGCALAYILQIFLSHIKIATGNYYHIGN